MMERDIRAVLDGLTLLVADTKGASQLRCDAQLRSDHGPVRRSPEVGY